MKPDFPHRPEATRRAWLAMVSGLSWSGCLPGHAAADPGGETRLALLVGNRDYPDGEDIPPAHKNVRDLQQALEQRGFRVEAHLDLGPVEFRAVVRRFAERVSSAPPDAIVWFYFTGQGSSTAGENLLIPARTSVWQAPEQLRLASLELNRDVLRQWPSRPDGLSMAVVDACRTSIRAEDTAANGLAQTEVPPGWLLAFASGFGRPALAPVSDQISTFYTASLVKLINALPGDVSFGDLFRLVKFDVQDTMSKHPIAHVRRFAQTPFIADNARSMRSLGARSGEAAIAVRDAKSAEAEAADLEWRILEGMAWPEEVGRLSGLFLKRFPNSRWAASAKVAEMGAAAAVEALKPGLLDRRAFQVSGIPAGGSAFDILRAGRGDKDAAARLGRALGRINPGLFESWMRYAAALGNGIAAYELAQYHRRLGDEAQAQRDERLARDLGYEPPVR